jgi:hypothetical protein
MPDSANGTSKITRNLILNQVLLIFELHARNDLEAFVNCLQEEGYYSELQSITKDGAAVLLPLPNGSILIKNTGLKEARVKLRKVAADNNFELVKCIAFDVECWSGWVSKQLGLSMTDNVRTQVHDVPRNAVR